MVSPRLSGRNKKACSHRHGQVGNMGSSEKRLTLSQIFDVIEERYLEWKNSKNRAWQVCQVSYYHALVMVSASIMDSSARYTTTCL